MNFLPELRIAAIKMRAADASNEAANVRIQTHRGFGFDEEVDIERTFRARCPYQVPPISTDLILAYLAVHVLGPPRFCDRLAASFVEI